MKSLCFLVVLLLLSASANAQTETVVNNAGATVIEVVTQNANGLPTTLILQTIVGTSTSQTGTNTASTSSNTLQITSTLPLVTTKAQQVGPVGQPASVTLAGGETPYTYTTTDSSGNTVVMEGIFTPTGPQTVLPAQTITGTVLGYTQWLSMIGTHTAPASAARRMSTPVATGWCYFAATAFAGLVGGAWLIIAL